MILAKGPTAVHWEMAFADCQVQCCGSDCSPLRSEQGQKWTLYTHFSPVSRPDHLPYNHSVDLGILSLALPPP